MNNSMPLPQPFTTPRCANCGHRKVDHFDSKGVCNLGFCNVQCDAFVPSL